MGERGLIGSVVAVVAFMTLFPSSLLTHDQDPYRPQFEASMMKSEGKMENGRVELEKLERLVTRSKLPRVGACWKDALDDLRMSCSNLDDEMQARLALGFTSCFSDMIGSANQICHKSSPVKACLKNLDNSGMDTFRQYFLHTQDMCYYLQSEIWHQETERAVNELQNAAFEMSRTVLEQKTVADSILESQHSSQQVQKEMLRENYNMFEKVINIKTSLEEFGAQAHEQRLVFVEIFEKLRKMQELVVWIQGEMSMIDLFTFYAGGVLFSYFLTASERTQRGRVWMIFSLVMGLAGERYIYTLLGENDMKPEEILEVISYYRRFILGITLGIFLFHAAKYRDYQAINNDLLTDMRQRLDLMMDFIEVHFKHAGQELRNGLPVPPPLPLARPLQVLPDDNEEDEDEESDLSEKSGSESENEDSKNKEDLESDDDESYKPDESDTETNSVPKLNSNSTLANANTSASTTGTTVSEVLQNFTNRFFPTTNTIRPPTPHNSPLQNGSPYNFRDRSRLHTPNRFESSNGSLRSPRPKSRGYYSSDDE